MSNNLGGTIAPKRQKAPQGRLAFVPDASLLRPADAFSLLSGVDEPNLSERLHPSYGETPWNDRLGRKAERAK
jgi:hypothetical protein